MSQQICSLNSAAMICFQQKLKYNNNIKTILDAMGIKKLVVSFIDYIWKNIQISISFKIECAF